MAASSDQMLTEILAMLRGLQKDVGALTERLTVVETNVKTLLHDTREDLADHEKRLRSLESERGAVLTRAEFEQIEDDKRGELNEALSNSDRKANVRLGIIIAAVTVVNVGLDAYSKFQH